MKIFGLNVSEKFVRDCLSNVTPYAEKLLEERHAALQRVAHWTYDEYERAAVAALRAPERYRVAARDAVLWMDMLAPISRKSLLIWPKERLTEIAVAGDGRALFDLQRLTAAVPSGEGFSDVLEQRYDAQLLEDYLHWALAYAIVRMGGEAPFIDWERDENDVEVSRANG